MPRGRPPKPESPLTADLGAAPECPSYLGRVAKKKWAEVVRVLATYDLLHEADQDAIALYCVAFERWRHAESKLKRGLVVRGKKGASQDPYLAISNRAQKQMNEMARKLGLNPDARRKLGVKPQPKQADNPKLKFFAAREKAG